eukprot:scaffold10120_cov17-Tisochrysis_lutea.AAC.1
MLCGCSTAVLQDYLQLNKLLHLVPAWAIAARKAVMRRCVFMCGVNVARGAGGAEACSCALGTSALSPPAGTQADRTKTVRTRVCGCLLCLSACMPMSAVFFTIALNVSIAIECVSLVHRTTNSSGQLAVMLPGHQPLMSTRDQPPAAYTPHCCLKGLCPLLPRKAYWALPNLSAKCMNTKQQDLLKHNFSRFQLFPPSSP